MTTNTPDRMVTCECDRKMVKESHCACCNPVNSPKKNTPESKKPLPIGYYLVETIFGTLPAFWNGEKFTMVEVLYNNPPELWRPNSNWRITQ